MDSVHSGYAMHYQTAKVVQMTTDELHNYLTINRGSKDGIVRGQGVRNTEGVVGIVRTVGQNYSVVLPIINTQMKKTWMNIAAIILIIGRMLILKRTFLTR